MNQKFDDGTGRSEGVFQLDLVDARVETSGFLQEQAGGLRGVLERELGRWLQLSAILKPLNSWRWFGCYVKLELHIGFGPVLNLVEIFLRYFDFWDT